MRPLRAAWLVSIAIAAVSFIAGYVVFSPKGRPRADGAAPAGTLRGMLAGRFSAASEDRVAALFAAFDEREPLRRDAAIFRAIEQLQPGDALGALGDLAALIRRVEKLPRDLWPHLAEAILERWLALDPDGALRWVDGALKLAEMDPNNIGRWDGATLQRVVEVLARRDPEWALRTALALPATDPRDARRQSVLSSLFQSLGNRDPIRARAFLQEIPAGKDRDMAKRALVLGWARSDSAAALAYAKSEMAPAAMGGMLLALANVLKKEGTSEDPSTSRRWIDEFSDPTLRVRYSTFALEMAAGGSGPFPYEWLTATVEESIAARSAGSENFSTYWLEHICSEMGDRDPDRLHEWVESLPAALRARANAAYFPTLARHDADAAFAWLATLPPDGLGSPSEAQRVFSAVAGSAPGKLNEWIAAQPPGPLRDAALAAHVFSLAGGAPEKAIANYGDALAFDPSGHYAARLALNATQKDPAATAAWLATLSPGVQQDRAARTAAEAWTWRDPTAAAEWVESLPAGPLRDSAIAGYAPVAMHADPAAAAASVERIAAPATKQAAAEKVFQVWLDENPIAARRWLRSLAGVESAWVEKTLRSMP